MPNSRTTTGLPPGVLAGATGPRLLAALVEVGPVWLLVGLALLFAFVFNGSVLVVVLCLVIALGWAALVWAQRATRAAGPGMRLDSLQVVGLSDGRPLGWGRVLLRWLVFAGLTVTVVGLIAMLIVMTRHPRRQGWHDLAANAVVIKERPLAPPRPEGGRGADLAAEAGSERIRGSRGQEERAPTDSRLGHVGHEDAAACPGGRCGRRRPPRPRRRSSCEAEGRPGDVGRRACGRRIAGRRRRRPTVSQSAAPDSPSPPTRLTSRWSRRSGCCGWTTGGTWRSRDWSCSVAIRSRGWGRRTRS